jgi:hypothetical protein
MEKFERIVAKIGMQCVEPLSVDEELWAADGFIPIYENPQPYFAPAIALLTRRDVSTYRKTIIAYTMLRLPEERFLELVSAVADSVERGVTEVQVLDRLAFPPPNFGRQHLIVHYQHAGVRAVLERLAKMQRLPEYRRTYIQDKVLTGQAKLDYLDYMNYIGHKPAEE